MRMRLELVAEGVETEWDAQFLAAAGYDYAQGFRYTARAAGGPVLGMDRGVQCHGHACRRRRPRDHGAAQPRPRSRDGAGPANRPSEVALISSASKKRERDS